jgi:hypothetical protein
VRDSLEHVFEGLDGAVEWVRSRAYVHDWPIPVTASDFLAWFEDEAERQAREMAENPEQWEREPFLRVLREVSQRLRALGVKAGALPWRESECPEDDPPMHGESGPSPLFDPGPDWEVIIYR